MFRKKIIALTAVTLSAFGLYSEAQADPISVSYNYSVTDLSAGLATFIFSIAVLEDTLMGMDSAIYDALGIDSWGFVPEAGWTNFDPEFYPDCTSGFDCLMAFESTGIAALGAFTFWFVADVGDAITDLGSIWLDFTFYFDGLDPFFTDSPTFDGTLACEECGAVNVPEPGTLGLLGLGLLGMAAARRRRLVTATT